MKDDSAAQVLDEEHCAGDERDAKQADQGQLDDVSPTDRHGRMSPPLLDSIGHGRDFDYTRPIGLARGHAMKGGRIAHFAVLVACIVGAVPAAFAQFFPEVLPAADPAPAAGVAAPPPLLGKEELQAEIQRLEAERARLLGRFAPAHPDVRAIERRLALRRAQLEYLERRDGSVAPSAPR